MTEASARSFYNDLQDLTNGLSSRLHEELFTTRKGGYCLPIPTPLLTCLYQLCRFAVPFGIRRW
jgi:hypothetical protein